MRVHGRAQVDASNPRALGVCDRCGFLYNLDQLRWQFQWVATRLQNIRQLVCDECYDTPQEQLRTVVLPPDPLPVLNARPEYYVAADNPLSPLGASANPFTPTLGSRIGNLTGGAGLNAAFDGAVNKQSWMSAASATVSNSSFNNYVGINWQGNVLANEGLIEDGLEPPIIEHSLSSVSIYAPLDTSFLGTTAIGYVIQCSPADTALYGAWTTIYSGTTAGTAGESIDVTITSTMTNTLSQFHRVAFEGDGATPVAVAQVQFNVAETGEV